MASTLLLDTVTWDLVVDNDNNIAVASEPYALAQDAASAIRTFKAEVYYDTRQGLPYFEQILGHTPPVSLMKSKFAAAALTVPNVAKAKCFIAGLGANRQLTGQVQITDVNGNLTATSF